MQVVCGNCQLSFDAPDGATGLVCPICRGPLRPQSAKGETDAGAAGAASNKQDWSGGDLDDLIAILSAPALSARVEVLPPSGDTPAGEVHLLAGGVSEALFGGQSTDDALDRLRAIKSARFRVEPRLPNPADGDLGNPGPESGTLESRALAHLMRYVEDYVITCSIEVWRGNENARVEYKRGEINGVTVGGIDAPERLAEVMKWASGNYRLIVPPLKIPATAPKRAVAAAATPAPVPAPAPSAQAARQASATKTMFGIPLAEVAKARAAAEAAKAAAAAAAPAAAPTSQATSSPAPNPAPSAAVSPAAPAARVAPSTVAAPAAAAPVAAAPAAAARGSATKTIFGVPAPNAPGGYVPGGTADASPPPEADSAKTAASRAEANRKMGARKVSVPAPDVVPPPAAAAAVPAAVTRSETTEPVKRPAATAPAAITRSETTEPVKRPTVTAPAAGDKSRPAKREASIWTYVLVGVVFGVALLAGVYYLVGLVAH